MFITDANARAHRSQAGLSLIELIVAIVVLSVGLVLLLIPISNVTRRSGDPLITKQATAIAEAVLEEIELKPFNNFAGDFPGPYTCPNRAQFDALPDYKLYASAGICDLTTGIVIAPTAGYKVAVALTPTAFPAIAPFAAIPAAQASVVTVSVTGPNATTVTLSGVRTSYF
jgi:MSHA pilin protein MshD